ncbi:hypothetical protein [Kocuria rosea]|uniref:hypothetical protein n=1 Tax=Kocuria rosea TaxID=1275 RepID=UPI000F84088D|nr:hypothetical protein [Kocuria rosea]
MSLIAAISLVGEAGLNSVMLSRGGKLKVPSLKFTYLVSSARHFRSRITYPTATLGGALIFVMLTTTGASPGQAVAFTGLSIASILFLLNTGICQNIHRLNLDFAFIRRIALASAFARLLVLSTFAYLFTLDAGSALAIGLFVYAANYFAQVQRTKKSLLSPVPQSRRYFASFSRAAKRTLPMTMLLVASEQSVILVLALNGSTTAIAEVTALARFGIVFTLINMLYADMVAPYIARLVHQPLVVFKRIGLCVAAYAGVGFAIWFAMHMISPFLLDLLGPEYNDLSTPFSIILTGQLVLNLGYSTGYLVQARGWTKLSWSYAIFVLAWLLCGISFLDLSSTNGAALFMASQALPLILTQCVRVAAGLRDEYKSNG